MKTTISLSWIALTVLSSQLYAQTTFFGPTPYLSEADIPALFYDTGAPGALENFEDGVIDFGLVLEGGFVATGGFVDSVDIDDGVIDGTGSSTGHSYGTFPGVQITIFFPAPYPRAAAFVWTDSVGGEVSFEALGPNLNTLGSHGPFALAQPGTSGQTDEDRFLGVRSSTGIRRIVITDTSDNFEIDHVQFGDPLDPTGIGSEFVRADCNTDGQIDISDSVKTLEFLFVGGSGLDCEKACDANDDSQVDLSDAVFSLSFLFAGGDSPATPFANCGADATTDALTCSDFSSCP